MPAPIRPLTNDFKACKVIKLDADDPRSPLVVMQEGCAPDDPTYRMRNFYLQRNGQWIDEIARSTRPDSEIGDIVFATSAEVLNILSSLFGKPVIRDVPVTDTDKQAYLAKVQSISSPKEAFRQFLARYRAAKSKA